MNANLRSVMRGTMYNLAGAVIPIAAGFLCIPRIIAGLELERFGALNLAWAFVGYFGFIDLGVGRALTQLVSKNLAMGDDDACAGIIGTGLTVVTIAGIAGALILTAMTRPILSRMLYASQGLSLETVQSAYVLAWSMPFVLLGGCFRGMLQAKQRFDLINLFGIPIGVLNFLLPLLLLSVTRGLQYIVGAVCLNRILSTAVYYALCRREYKGIEWKWKLHRHRLREIFDFGGWVTVGNVVGPMTLYIDRFVIAGLLSLTSVAYYTTPFEMVTKALILSSSFAGVMFPVFSTVHWSKGVSSYKVYEISCRYLLLCFLPICVAVVLFSREVIAWWISPDFAAHSYRVSQILAVGVLFIGLGAIPFNYLQSTGFPRIPVILNVVEIPVYFVLIYVLTKRYDILGAAIAWTFRGVLDFYLMRLVLFRKTGFPWGTEIRTLLTYAIPLLLMPLAMFEIRYKLILFLASLLLYLFLCYKFVYRKSDFESTGILASEKI